MQRLVSGGVAPSVSAPNARHVRLLQVALGVLWLVDGALQLQPFMFTKGFVTTVLVPAATGNAAFVAAPALFVAHRLAPDVAVGNALFACTQLVLGAGIVAGALGRRPRVLRAMLAGSVLWAAMVWWLGEGIGGILTGASPLGGAPGAVALYAVAGVFLWPGRHDPAPLLGSRVASWVWGILWVLSACLLLEPDNRGRDAVSSVVSAAAAGEPTAVRGLLGGAATALRGAGGWVDPLLAVVMLGIAAAVALRVLPRLALGLSVALAGAVWVFGEAFGAVLTGQGTDPNTGPLWVLLALCMAVGLRRQPASSAASAVQRPVSPAAAPGAWAGAPVTGCPTN